MVWGTLERTGWRASGFTSLRPLGLGGAAAQPAGNLHLVGALDPAKAAVNASMEAEPGVVKLAVRVGQVYAVIGVDEKVERKSGSIAAMR
jgi:hypothetical protein